jgi:hypothetical protein
MFVSINNEPAVRVQNAYEWYAQNSNLPICGDPDALFPSEETAARMLSDCLSRYQRVWLVTRRVEPVHETMICDSFFGGSGNALQGPHAMQKVHLVTVYLIDPHSSGDYDQMACGDRSTARVTQSRR